MNLDAVVNELKKSFPTRAIFHVKCDNPCDHEENKLKYVRVGETDIVVVAVDPSFSAMNITEWVLGMDRKTLFWHTKLEDTPKEEPEEKPEEAYDHPVPVPVRRKKAKTGYDYGDIFPCSMM